MATVGDLIVFTSRMSWTRYIRHVLPSPWSPAMDHSQLSSTKPVMDPGQCANPAEYPSRVQPIAFGHELSTDQSRADKRRQKNYEKKKERKKVRHVVDDEAPREHGGTCSTSTS